MESLEQLRDRLLARFPGAKVELVTNPGPTAEHSLLLGAAHGRDVALFLRDDEALKLDYCSNATGVDWPGKEIVETVKKTIPAAAPSAVAGVGDPGPGSTSPATTPATKVVEEKIERIEPGYLEAIYHLYSMAKKHGPVIIRLRTGNRSDDVTLPSLTPVWRSCDFQEREIYDLFGIVFEGHRDLRRLLMWDEFKDHPMRKDYVAPDDFEWEPTPHGDVHERAKVHYPSPVAEPPDEPRRSPQGEGGPATATKEAPKP